MNPFRIQILYFVSLSFLGFGLLKLFNPRTRTDSFHPTNLDLFFTCVSAATVSSMSTVEMEVFSNPQLILLTLLMFMGGEVFTSMVGLHLRKYKINQNLKKDHVSDHIVSRKASSIDILELSVSRKSSSLDILELSVSRKPSSINILESFQNIEIQPQIDTKLLKYNSIRLLSFVVLGYLVFVNLIGIILLLVYISSISSARNVLKTKGINLVTFSFFTVISTFASCGFVPTNENMIVFSKNSGLLLILIPQVLLGNTLFPCCLRLVVWLLGKMFKKEESNFLLKKSEQIGYLHLLPNLHSCLLVVTVFGFILIQFILFSSLEWTSNGLNGLTTYQKFIGIMFQVINTRHTGETIVDISTISPAILVLFVVMMYLPPYTSFLPINHNRGASKRKRGKVLENIILSQLSYLVIFIILVCITERKKMKQDPLNFNVLNIVIEVISAYGNVGFTMGYSCARQIQGNQNCKDKLFGFSGKWSDEGKMILILVMFFGRLKKFNMNGGKAWILL
ncbi:sodium transporter HKT1-like [Euphorbia lathyris]|uniref:sodium transporter HKT1-like n=1 Tax=Euphorbia lathyris TaxID=212925 RepID=UPI0033143D89